MDPNTCARKYFEALAANNLDDQQDYFLWLLQWMRGGGFGPTLKHTALAESCKLLSLNHRQECQIEITSGAQTGAKLACMLSELAYP